MSLINNHLLKSAADVIRPAPKMRGSEFVNKNLYVQTGKVTLYPWQEEPLDVCLDDEHEEIMFMKPSRVGYTEVIIGGVILWAVTNDPNNILIAQPTDDEAYGYAEDNLTKLIQANKSLHDALTAQPLIGKKKKERTTKKVFKGVWLEVVGAHSPKNFRRRSAKYLIADEIGGWEIGAGKEGDQLKLMKRRGADFYDMKFIKGSTPTTEGCRTWQEYISGDQRNRYYHCPECGELHKWEQKNLHYDIKNGVIPKESVKMSCPHCGAMYGQDMQHELDLGGVWIPENKDALSVSFYISGFMSRSPQSTWWHIAQALEDAKKDPERLMQPVVNTMLGLPYTEKHKAEVSVKALRSKKETYPTEVPDGAKVLIMSVDTQNDRLEWNVIGYGVDDEAWLIDRGIIHGDPAQPQPWNTLEGIYDKKKYASSDGAMGIYALGIDAGGGRTRDVYAFCYPRLHKRVYALRGATQIDAEEVSRRIVRDKGSPYYGMPYIRVGVNRIKDIVFVGLKTPAGRYAIHFPRTRNFDDQYFEQLTTEYKDGKGRWVKRHGGARNEAIDLLVYGMATLISSGADPKIGRYIDGDTADEDDFIELDGGI